MLSSLIALTALLETTGLSARTEAASGVPTATSVEYSLYRPEDPSTLTLALIGAGSLAVYFGFRRAIRMDRPTMPGETLGPHPHFEAAANTEMQPVGELADEASRGAA